MSLDDTYAKPISLEDLQQFKALTPLPDSVLDELRKIEKLDVTGFYETEVRTFIIDPIVKILGYDKGTDFSVDLGRPIEFLNKNRFPDYNFNLWRENFWLIEAKRPKPTEAAFGYEDLAQAVEYAIHPNINAALVVLCDGVKIEIFDREVSLTAPILHVDKADLTQDFDKLRSLMEPMQVWFFQKRRIVRLLDKVFDKEFNLQRVEEFRTLIDRRLVGKRAVVLENFRRNVKPDDEDQKKHLTEAPIEELVEVHLFLEHSIPLTNVLIHSLAARCEHNSFHVLHRIFPDHPRDCNDIYMAQALAFLVALTKKRSTVEWLPAWLAQGSQTQANPETAAGYLLSQCLSYFGNDEPRRIILLAAAAMRRITKLFYLSNEAQWRMGETLHFLGRYNIPELSWRQVVSSPAGHLIGQIDGVALTATHRFLKSNQGEHGEFKPEVAKLGLADLWKLEKALLKSIGNYLKLRSERALGDMRMTEWASVTYDNLGHSTLCLLHPFPEWTAYALSECRPLVETLASMNSWKAKELLGHEQLAEIPPPSDADLAARFFFGDIETLQELRRGYSSPK